MLETQTINPNTRNGVDTSYTFTLQNTDVARITLVGSGAPVQEDEVSTKTMSSKRRVR